MSWASRLIPTSCIWLHCLLAGSYVPLKRGASWRLERRKERPGYFSLTSSWMASPLWLHFLQSWPPLCQLNSSDPSPYVLVKLLISVFLHLRGGRGFQKLGDFWYLPCLLFDFLALIFWAFLSIWVYLSIYYNTIDTIYLLVYSIYLSISIYIPIPYIQAHLFEYPEWFFFSWWDSDFCN